MRDIRPEGDFIVNGDFTVNEGSQSEYIPFEQMNVEQLNHSLKLHQNWPKRSVQELTKYHFAYWVSRYFWPSTVFMEFYK